MKKVLSLLIISCFIFSFLGCKNKVEEKAKTKEQQIVEDLKEAYIFGFPLMMMHFSETVMTNPIRTRRMPLNQFFHNSEYIDSEFQGILRPKGDAFYSVAWVELSKEPIVLIIPDIKDNYALFNILDAWHNNILSVGTNTQISGEQKYVISQRSQKYEVPENMQQIKTDSSMIMISALFKAGNIQDAKKKTVPLQKQLKIIPLSEYDNKKYKAPQTDPDPAIDMSNPAEQIFNLDISSYFNMLNTLIIDNPIYQEDKVFMEKIKYLKIEPYAEFYMNAFPEIIHEEIESIPRTIKEYFDSKYLNENDNGWIKADIIKNYGIDYEKRAFNVYKFFDILQNEDMLYFQSCDILNGANNYILHFDKNNIPEADGFWSICAYRKDLTFEKNIQGKYAIGSENMPKLNEDGSLDIYIQKNAPSDAKIKNWLPCPANDFILAFTAYSPGDKIRNINWKIPEIIRQ